MSVLVAGESRKQDVINAAKGSNRCRIPQRLPTGRIRAPMNTASKLKGEAAKQKIDPMTAQHNRFALRNITRSRLEEQPRPKSANRAKDDLYTGRFMHPTARLPRNDRHPNVPKRPSTLPKLLSEPNKATRGLIMVPLTQRPGPGRNVHMTKINPGLPDQETIKKHEDMESTRSEISDTTHIYNDIYDKESITSRTDKVMQLKIVWQEKMVLFEKMKNELTDRQKAIMEVYAIMRNTHQKMTSLGEKTNLPPAEDLRIMNVTKLSPEQLLQLCAESTNLGDKPQGQDAQAVCKNILAIDVNKMYNMPTKLVDTCEQILLKRKEVIDWFESLKKQNVTLKILNKKLNEFNTENDMLKSCLDQVKAEFVKEIEEIVEFLRKNVKDTMTIQLRSEELNYALSELNSQNADLRKQIHNSDHLRSQTNKTRIEELQKEVKEEKCKRTFLQSRLSRAEGQVKMNQDRGAQLEAALEQAQSQTRNLERTVQQLNDKNQKLQIDFDKELNKLNESLRNHTIHLEEIADSREKLQTEKEDLEKRLSEIAEHYNESLKHIKHEMNVNVVKLIDTENKFVQEKENNTKLEAKVESLVSQLLEAELRFKAITKQLEENKDKLGMTINVQRELEATKKELHEAQSEIINCKNIITKQNEIIAEIERSYKESSNMQQTLKCALTAKDEYIAELEKKQNLLEQQLQENESKMESYVEQLTTLKAHIAQLQEYFGEFENLSELHDKLNQQQAQLLEMTGQNGELSEALQKKEEELEQLSSGLVEQEHGIDQREGLINILSEKEKEQTNIIKILRNNLELRSQADNNLNQQITEKNLELETLVMEIDNSKQQMSNLEKIILTLQDQIRKASNQRKKDQEKIAILQNKIAEYEAYHTDTSRINDAPADNLDNLIKIIENELGSPMEPQMKTKAQEYDISKIKYTGDRKQGKLDYQEEMHNASLYPPELANIATDNFVKKSYISANKQYEGDHLDRKRAVASTHNWTTAPDLGINSYNSPATRETNFPNLKGIIPGEHQKQSLQYNHCRDRKYKMYKLAGHRL